VKLSNSSGDRPGQTELDSKGKPAPASPSGAPLPSDREEHSRCFQSRVLFALI
jgi:hypothetical protein